MNVGKGKHLNAVGENLYLSRHSENQFDIFKKKNEQAIPLLGMDAKDFASSYRGTWTFMFFGALFKSYEKELT